MANISTEAPGALPGGEPDALPGPSPGRRNERLLIAGVLGYSALVLLLMFFRGVEVTPDVMVVAFGLAAVLLGRGRLFLRDWLPFLVLLLAYELMRGLADNVGFPVHVADMVTAERLVVFGQVPNELLQSALHPATGVDVIAEVATVVYMLHFALPLVTGFRAVGGTAGRRLRLRGRADHPQPVCVRDVRDHSGRPALVRGPTGDAQRTERAGGHLLPQAGRLRHPRERTRLLGRLHLHVRVLRREPERRGCLAVAPRGYPFLTFLVLRRSFGRVGWLAFAYMLLVAFSVMYTGDHWLIDCFGGIAYAYVSFYVVTHAAAAQAMLARFRDDSPVGRSWSALRR